MTLPSIKPSAKHARPGDDCRFRHKNIIASATYWRGKPAHCLEAWVQGRFALAISHPILSEYEKVIARLAARFPQRHPTDWLTAIR